MVEPVDAACGIGHVEAVLDLTTAKPATLRDARAEGFFDPGFARGDLDLLPVHRASARRVWWFAARSPVTCLPR